MGKHSVKGISYWEARSRRKDLRNRSKAPRNNGPIKMRWMVFVFIFGIVAGGSLGYFYKPIAKAGAELYLSFKSSQWQVDKTETKEVEENLTPVSEDPDKSVNILVLGSDEGSNKGESGYCRSDVMMLVCLQERDKKAVVISIPRDTKVSLAGHGTNKINAAHSYDGPSGAIAAVNDLLGLDVHHYISMNFVGFKQIINALGGVPIHLEKAINDPHAGYLPKGDLLLDGEQALVIVRSRRLPGGDIDRIKSQQGFLKALLKKATEMADVWKAKQMVDIVASTCKMDFSAGQLLTLAEEMRGFTLESVQFMTVPGVAKNIGGASYFVADEELIPLIAQEVNQNNQISPELTAKINDASILDPNNERVQTLNAPDADVITVLGTGKSVTSSVPTVATELKLLGHAEVHEGKANSNHATTTIYFRGEAKDMAANLKNSVPEFKNADLVQDNEVAVDYNSPIVVVLGTGFQTPSLVSIYGRVMIPSVDFKNLGEKVNSIG
ncbi:MAG: LCP family protein [Actinobacteria bacterium]|nr:LCP family protein [Actinomycetota bacterium]